MAQMAVLAAVTMATTAMTSMAQKRQGQAENEAAKHRARQLEHQAKQETAAGQHKAEEQRRQSQILQSRALAAAGASGGGTLDSNVLRMISGIAEEGEEDVLRTSHASKTAAGRARQGAAMSRTEGKIAKRAGKMKAFGTALEGMSNAATSGGPGSLGFGR